MSERLGHATIAVTMDIYPHVLPGLDREAADTVARLVLGGSSAVSEASVNKPLASGRSGEVGRTGVGAGLLLEGVSEGDLNPHAL